VSWWSSGDEEDLEDGAEVVTSYPARLVELEVGWMGACWMMALELEVTGSRRDWLMASCWKMRVVADIAVLVF
jgi:hypothetical protein